MNIQYYSSPLIPFLHVLLSARIFVFVLREFFSLASHVFDRRQCLAVPEPSVQLASAESRLVDRQAM